MNIGRRAGWWSRTAFVVGMVGFAGCDRPTNPPVDFSDSRRAYDTGDYRSVYDRWTRHQYALHDVDKALEVWATFKSWDFREAFIERYSSLYSLSETDRSTLRKAQLESFHKAYEFHVTAQSSEYKWNDLEKGSSAWKITLIDAVGHELPAEPIRVQKLPEAYEIEFFPNRTPFSKTYIVRFVPDADGSFAGVKSGGLTLRFASPVGRVDLTWRS